MLKKTFLFFFSDANCEIVSQSMAPNISQIVQEMVGELQPQNEVIMEEITKKDDNEVPKSTKAAPKEEPKVIVISESLPSIENSEALPKIPIPPKSFLKPDMSNKSLTAMAIQNLPNQKGTQPQIFNWIRKKFPYFQKIPPGKWTDDILNVLKSPSNEFMLVPNDIRYQKTSSGAKQIINKSMFWKINPKNYNSKEFLELGEVIPPKNNPAADEIPKIPEKEVPKIPAEVKENFFKCDQCDQSSFKTIHCLNDHVSKFVVEPQKLLFFCWVRTIGESGRA